MVEDIKAVEGLQADQDLHQALELATLAALEAGQLIKGYFGTGVDVDRKVGDEPVTRADREAQALILKRLTNTFPSYGVLAEEQEDTTSWSQHKRSWIIDPLDGTKDFIAGRPGFSVMIGLLEDSRPILGVVHQPIGHRTFMAVKGGGAMMLGGDGDGPTPLRVSPVQEVPQLRLVASKSHRSQVIDQAKAALGIDDEINVGSVGLKISLIARAERDLYLNPEGHCKLWDTCAPEIIVQEAGGQMTDIFGDPLVYSPEEIRITRGILASNGCCHTAVVQALAPLFGSAPR